MFLKNYKLIEVLKYLFGINGLKVASTLKVTFHF